MLVLRSTGGLPAHIAGAFEKPLGFQQSDAGVYFVFDRRAHAVYSIAHDTSTRLINIGAEPGRVLDPSAFDIDPADGSFVVADAPLRRQRVQAFTAGGSRLGGFTLPSKEVARVTLDSVVLNGVGSIQIPRVETLLLVNQPETGVLDLGAVALRLSHRGARSDSCARRGRKRIRTSTWRSTPDCRSSTRRAASTSCSSPASRRSASTTPPARCSSSGTSKDLSSTTTCGRCRSRWPLRANGDGDLLPLVLPAVRAAGVDRQGRLWIALMQPYTYVYDPGGEKIRTVQFKGADTLSPSSLFFTKDGRILVTPGCYELRSPAL